MRQIVTTNEEMTIHRSLDSVQNSWNATDCYHWIYFPTHFIRDSREILLCRR